MKEVFKVSSKTEPGKLAGAMAGVVRTGGEISIQAIGAGAVNQAIKAVAIARGFLAPGANQNQLTTVYGKLEEKSRWK